MTEINPPMGIYRCKACHFWGKGAMNLRQCVQCGQAITVYDALQVAQTLSTRYHAALREIESLKNQQFDKSTHQETHQKKPRQTQDLAMHNTDKLSKPQQHLPLQKWFEKHAIKPEFNYAAVDTSGFYDEAADHIGQNYPLLQKIMRHINANYSRNTLNVHVDLKKYSQQEQQKITQIFRELHSYTLFSVYNYNKNDKNLFLKLQPATPVRQFFKGEWLEWFVLNRVLETVQEHNIRFSVARNIKICFPNQDVYELDVVLYTPNQKPIVIECKTGEYRAQLDKYLKLRKNLNISASNFILLTLDLDETQANALSKMYDLTFVTPNTLTQHLKHSISLQAA